MGSKHSTDYKEEYFKLNELLSILNRQWYDLDERESYWEILKCYPRSRLFRWEINVYQTEAEFAILKNTQASYINANGTSIDGLNSEPFLRSVKIVRTGHKMPYDAIMNQMFDIMTAMEVVRRNMDASLRRQN